MNLKRIAKNLAILQVVFYVLTIFAPFSGFLPKIYADGAVPGLDCGNLGRTPYAGLECYIRGILRPVSIGSEYSANCVSVNGGNITHDIRYSNGARFRFCFGTGHGHPLTNQEAIQKVRYTSSSSFVVIESLQSYQTYNQTPNQPNLVRPQNGWELGPRTNGTYSGVSCNTTGTGLGCSIDFNYTINDPDYANYINTQFELQNTTNNTNQNFTDNRQGNYTSNRNIPDGSWRWRGITSDTWANSGWTGYRNFVVDTTAPSVPVINTEPDFTPSTQNQITVNPVIDNLIGGVQYEFEISLVSDFSSVLNTSGWVDSANYTFANLVDETTYYYRVRSRDSLHNVSNWASIASSTQDARLPTLENVVLTNSRISPQNADSVADSANISFDVSDKYLKEALLKVSNAQGVVVREISLDIRGGGENQSLNFAWDGKDNSSNFLVDGGYSLVLEIKDLAGNTTTSESLIVVVDNTPASLNLSNITNGGWLNYLNYTISGQTEADATALMSVSPLTASHNLSIDTNGLFNQLIDFSLGLNIISTNIKDSIGNIADYQTNLYLENVKPEVVINTPSGNINNRREAISLTLNDLGVEVDSVSYISGINPNSLFLSLNHQTQGEIVLVNQGINTQSSLGNITHDCNLEASLGQNYKQNCNFTYNFNADLTPDGNYTIKAQVRDISGNQSNEVTKNFTLDSNTYLEISSPNSGQLFNYSQIEIRGVAEEGSNLKIYVDDLNLDADREYIEFIVSDSNEAEYIVSNCRDSQNPQTDGIKRLCDFVIPSFQLERQLASGSLTNTIHAEITDSFSNTQIVNKEVNVDLFAVNLNIAVSNIYFSPNGDGRQDGLEFRDISTTAKVQSYFVEILSGLDVVRSFSGAGSIASNIGWDGRDSNGNFLISGVYQYRLRVISTDNVEFTTTPQNIEAVTELTDRVVITAPENNSFSSRGVVNVQGQAPIGTIVKLCDDVIGLSGSCDFEFSAAVNNQGFFSLILPLYRLENTQNTEHLIKAWAIDKYGNNTVYSNTVKVTVTTLSPFDSIEVLPVFTGVNNELDYQLILNKLDAGLPITQADLASLRSVILRSRVNSGTERVKLSFSQLTNLSELPESIQTNYLGYVDNAGAALYKDYTDGVTPINRCQGGVCTWDFYFPVPPQLGGLYEVNFQGKLDSSIQTLSSAFTVDGRIPAAPMVLDINKEVNGQLIDTNTFENKYYTNSSIVQIRGVSDPNAQISVTSNLGNICSTQASAAGIWQCVSDISDLVGANTQIQLELNIQATVGANSVSSIQPAYLVYDIQLPSFDLTNNPNLWQTSGNVVEISLLADEKLSYSKHVDLDPNTLGNQCINATYTIPLLNISVQLGAVNDFVLSTNRLNANGSFSISGMATEGRYCNFLEISDLAGNKVTRNLEWYIDNTNPVTPSIDTTTWGIYNGLNTQVGYIAEGRLVPGYVHEEKDILIGVWVEESLNTDLIVDTQINQTKVGPDRSNINCRVRTNQIGVEYTDIVIDGVLVQSRYECLNIFSYSFNSEKGYLFQGKVVDMAGNESLISDQKLIYYDITAPRTPEILEAKKANGASITDWQIAKEQNVTAAKLGIGNFGSLPITNDKNLAFTDYGEARSDMQYQAFSPSGGNILSTVSLKEDSGRNTNNYSLNFGDGVYSFVSNSIDASGNTSNTNYTQIELDTLAPNTPGVSLTLNGGQSPTGIQMSVSGEPGSRPSIATSARLNTSERTSFQIKSLSIYNDSDWERSFTYCTALVDRAGNRSGSVCRSIQTPIRPIRPGECDLTADRQNQIQQILNGNTELNEGQSLASTIYSRSCLYYAADVVNQGLQSAQSDLESKQTVTQECIKNKSTEGKSTQDIINECNVSSILGVSTTINMQESDQAKSCMDQALLASTSLDDAIRNCNIEKYYQGENLEALKTYGKDIESKIIERDHFESLNWAQQLGYRFVKGATDLVVGTANLVVNTVRSTISLGTQTGIFLFSALESARTGEDLGNTFRENRQDVRNAYLDIL